MSELKVIDVGETNIIVADGKQILAGCSSSGCDEVACRVVKLGVISNEVPMKILALLCGEHADAMKRGSRVIIPVAKVGVPAGPTSSN